MRERPAFDDAAASEAEQPAAYTTAAPVSDAVIDVSSVLVTTAAPQQSEYDVLDANGIDYNDSAIATKITFGNDGYITRLAFNGMSEYFAGKDFDFTGLAKLKELNLTDCGVNSLAIADSASLQTLYVSGNNLTDLDVSGCSSLYNLQCADNAIEDLNLAGTALTILNCSGNNISELDLSSSPRLSSLACFDNNLTVIDATPCANLGSLQFYDGLLETVYVNHNADVTMQIYVKKSECDLSVVDADLNEITTTASENYFQFTLGAAAANPITATVTFRNANGATQTI